MPAGVGSRAPARGIRRWIGGRAALWVAFAIVHAALAALNLYGQGLPLGDVTGVYRIWAENAAHGYLRMGIDAPWVYPILAFAPMAASLVLGDAWFGQSWLAIVTVLDGIAFAVLLGRARLSRPRRIAAWWWLGFLLLLGPIALGRIDAVTVPFAMLGLLWAAGRPRVAAVLLTIGAWIKVWPAALVAALVIASRRRGEVIAIAVSLSIGILGVSLLAGAGANTIGFVAEQAGRGLQIEAPLAVGWLWAIVAGDEGVRIAYDRDILTFQVYGPGVETAAWLTTPMLVVGVASVVAVGVRAARRGAPIGRLLAPLALAFVVVLMLGNKVGSPQFTAWLAAPVVLGLVLRPSRFLVPAVLAGAAALVTQIIYPYWYGWLLAADPAFVLLLTAKVGLLVALFAWAVRAVWQSGDDRRSTHAGRILRRAERHRTH